PARGSATWRSANTARPPRSSCERSPSTRISWRPATTWPPRWRRPSRATAAERGRTGRGESALEEPPPGRRVRHALLPHPALRGPLLQVRVHGLAGHRVELLGHVGVNHLHHLQNGAGAVAERVEDLPLPHQPVVDVFLDLAGAVLDDRAVGGI